MKSGGPWLKKVLDQINEWQLDHPEGSKEELSVWLKTGVERDEIGAFDDFDRASKRVKTGTL